jgi:hypothetical protein
MSKILQKGDTGFGILIESDAGYVDMSLNKDMLTEGVIQVDPDKPVIINCILQKWGVENRNGRIYPEDILRNEVERYQELVETSSAVSEADHPDCQLPDSEILTLSGWKKLKEISNDEIIATLNSKTNNIEYQKIDKKIYQKYSGLMYEFNGRNFTNTVTPNHRFLLEDNKGVRFYMTADEIYNDVGGILSSGKNKILKTGNWIGDKYDTYTLKGVNKRFFHSKMKKQLIETYSHDVTIDGNVWFAFMGIFLSEGHTTNSKGFEIGITQKVEDKKSKIRDLLSKLPFHVKEYTKQNNKTQFIITDARLYNYLKPLGKSNDKYIPDDLKLASKEQLQILLDWFLMGDGRSIKTKNNTYKKSVFSTSEKLINDLHEILIKTGGSGNISIQNNHLKNSSIKDKKVINVLADGTEEIIYENRIIKASNRKPLYNLNISNTKHIWLDKRSVKINQIDYSDKVACVRVKNGNFYTRVNGKAHWTGNSSVVSLNNISHLIKKMWWGEGDDSNVLYGQLEIITSPAYMKTGLCSMIGDKIVEYLKRGIRLGISSRGIGSLKKIQGKNIVQDDFELICFDLVASPSTPGAYLFPENSTMMETEIVKPKSESSTQLNEEKNKVIDALKLFLD